MGSANKNGTNKNGAHKSLGISLRRFLADRRGSTFMMFGLALPVVMLMLGLTVNYGSLQRVRSQLAAAADAAALAGVSAANTYFSGYTGTGDPTAAATAAGKAAAINAFNSNASAVTSGSVSLNPAPSVVRSGTTLTATVTYTYTATSTPFPMMGAAMPTLSLST